MSQLRSHDESDANDAPVGPFTGFGNFFRKELTDWWKSWRLILVFAIPTLVQVLVAIFTYEDRMEMIKRFAERENFGVTKQFVATAVLLEQFMAPILFIFIIIFSTMGILATEK